MQATINGRKVKCLIDTGSTSSLIKESVLKKIGLTYDQNADKILRGFAGNLVQGIGSVRTLVSW
jgi:hypothetical protein